MAALVESGMRNLPGGDADSVGFFQMRASIWDQGEYAGYRQAPKLQVKWFLDHAEAVKRDRLARGLPMDEKAYGEWIADVERPAAQYRGRYQLRFEEARELLRARDVHAPAAEVVDAATDLHARGPARASRAHRGAPVPGQRVPVGRLVAEDRVRLLRARPMGVRQGRHLDPARDRPADPRSRGDEGRPARPAARRPRVLPRPDRLRAPRRDLARRRPLRARSPHRRRRQGLLARRAVLLRPVHRRPALRPAGRGGRRGARDAGRSGPTRSPRDRR